MLAVVSMLLVLSNLFTWFYNARKSAESRQALLTLHVQEQSLDALKSELETLRNERHALVQGRIPGLSPLTYDEMITTDNETVRNIIFTKVKNRRKKTYEYHLVLNNNTLSPISPIVEIMLFNEVGIQVGSAGVGQTNGSAGPVSPALEPGEVRSYTANIDLMRNEAPRYFLLNISNIDHASATRPQRRG
jgi:hypothetical protein